MIAVTKSVKQTYINEKTTKMIPQISNAFFGLRVNILITAKNNTTQKSKMKAFDMVIKPQKVTKRDKNKLKSLYLSLKTRYKSIQSAIVQKSE